MSPERSAERLPTAPAPPGGTDPGSSRASGIGSGSSLSGMTGGISSTPNSIPDNSASHRGSSWETASRTRSSNRSERVLCSGTPAGTSEPRSPRPCRSRRRTRPALTRPMPSPSCTVTERIPALNGKFRRCDLAAGDTIAQCAPGGGVTVWRSIPSAVVSDHHDPRGSGANVLHAARCQHPLGVVDS